MSSYAHPLSAEDAPAWPEDAVEVGRILGAWGIKGALKVKAFAADPQALFSSKRWFIAAGEDQVLPLATSRSARSSRSMLRITSAREQGELVVAAVEDIADRNAAEALAGMHIFVSRQSFPTPTDDEFYWVDLIGLAVVNREGVAMGQVVGLLETGPHCVLRLKPQAEGAEERLVPFVNAYVDGVDIAGRLITVDWQPDF